MNTEHCSRILRIILSQISLFLYIHFFELSPDATWTQYLAHRCTKQFPLRSVSITRSLVHTPHTWSLTAASPFAHQPKDSPLHYKLCCLWAQESTLSTGHSLYCRERTPSLSNDREIAPLPSAHCLAVGRLPRHSLTVLPWDGSLAICSLSGRGMASLPSAASSPSLREETPSLSVCRLARTWLPRHLMDASYITVRIFRCYPLAVSLRHGSLAIRFMLLYRCEIIPLLSACHIAVRRLPAGILPLGRLSW